MKLLNREQVNGIHADHTFGTPPWIMLVPSGLMFGICGLLVWALIDNPNSVFLWFSISLIFPIAIYSFVVGFLPTLSDNNWVMKIKGCTIYVMLGDYRTARTNSPIANIATFRQSDIQSVREIQQLVSVPGPEPEKQIQRRERYLEFELKNGIPAALREALFIESRSDTNELSLVPKVRLVKSSVSVDGAKLRILWNGKNQMIRPSLSRAIEIINDLGVTELSAIGEEKSADELLDGEFEEFLLELCRHGDRMSAVKLLCEQRGLSITDSVKELEAFAEKQLQKQTI